MRMTREDAEIIDELPHPWQGLPTMSHTKYNVQGLVAVLTNSTYIMQACSHEQAVNRGLGTHHADLQVSVHVDGDIPHLACDSAQNAHVHCIQLAYGCRLQS